MKKGHNLFLLLGALAPVLLLWWWLSTPASVPDMLCFLSPLVFVGAVVCGVQLYVRLMTGR